MDQSPIAEPTGRAKTGWRATAPGDLRVLNSEKARTASKIGNGISMAAPIGLGRRALGSVVGTAAPEIDPASALSVLTMLLGRLTLLRSRRAPKTCLTRLPVRRSGARSVTTGGTATQPQLAALTLLITMSTSSGKVTV